MAAAEGESMVAARERCTIRDCECCWLYLPQIPRIAPGSDYVRIPAGADHRPAWSLLVGITNGATSSIRVSRLCVARSGRILGRSDDKLEVFHDIILHKPPAYSFDAGAALAPEGRSLYFLRKDGREQSQALQLSLQLDTEESVEELPLPEIQGTRPDVPISAAGCIWALYATEHIETFRVVTRRLVTQPDGRRRWEQVGDPFTSPLIHSRFPDWGGWFLQGYSVLPGDKLILVSFAEYGLFFTFATDSGCWTRVHTDPKRWEDYLPIKGRATYMEQHNALCMLWENTIYAYKLTYHKDDQGMELLSLDPPIKVALVCPFALDKGYGFLTRLADRLLCSVWISLAMHDPCPCDNLHAIITTFHLRDLAQGGIDVLHSTYRRVNMVPYPQHQDFCFLQEYEDKGSQTLLQHEEDQKNSSQHVNEPSKMLACCRSRMENLSLPRRCFECGGNGHVAWQCTEIRELTMSTIPFLGPSCSLQVDTSSRQHTVSPATRTIKKNLFIICQAGSQSVIFKTGATGDHDKPLKLCHVADGGDLHFFLNGSKIYAVSSIRDGMHEFSLNKDWKTTKLSVGRPIADPFIMVMRVGGVTIALTDSLRVFHQTKYSASTSWLPYKTKGDVVCKKLSMSGYVVVNDDSFIVCDAVTRLFFQFNMGAKQWRFVMPWAAFKEDLPRTNGLLNGRCVFVDGFIYTCRNGGLAAYELVGENGCVYISKPIILPFSWHADCVGEDMCLDYAGKDKDSGAILFYVVQGGYSRPKHAVQITTVKVKTKRRAGNQMIPVGIDHVGSVTRSIRDKKAIDTRCCFAV